MPLSVPRAQQILDAALDLAENQGVGGVTTSSLARRLGFTEAALYRYFDGKTGILVGALQHLGERLLATMLLEIDVASVSEPAHAGRQLWHHAVRFAYRQGLLLELLLFATANRAEYLREAANAFMQEYRQRMTVYFAQLQEKRLATPDVSAEELGRMWVCQLLGGFLHTRLAAEPWNPVEQAGFRAFCSMLFPGISCAPPAPPTPAAGEEPPR